MTKIQSKIQLTERPSDNQHPNVVPLFPDRRGIQFLPGLRAYVDRVLGSYDQVVWGLNSVKAIEITNGYPVTLVRIKFPYGGVQRPIKVTGCHHESAQPTEAEETAIQAELAAYAWPQLRPITSSSAVPVPSGEVEDRNDYFDTDAQLVMVEYRLKGKAGFPCVTFWDDGEYRWVPPPTGNPLLGLERLNSATAAIFLHEGGNGAKRGMRITDGKEPDHPWAEELSNAVHVGWTGGANNVEDTDWSPIDRQGLIVYVVADNDEPGRAAIVKIAKQLKNATVFAIEFDPANWPAAFDLGDDFPDAFWDVGPDGHRRYVGPTFLEMVAPATFMTTEKVVKGKTVWSVRPQWLRQWRFSAVDNQYLNIHNPGTPYKSEILNKVTQPFKHAGCTTTASAFINGGETNHVGMFEYRPDQNHSSPQKREFGPRNDRRYNTFEPTKVKPIKGDTALFHEFLSFVLEDAVERREVLRWLYTLAGQPQKKMKYGLLLISEESGTGKSTLLTEVAVPLVGLHNTSQPSTEEIQGRFNDWLSGRRLVVVDECYLGGKGQHEFSNRLKSVVTQGQIWVNPKGLPGKTVANPAHMGLSSNSDDAMNIEQKDRRWLIPGWTEKRWPAEKFQKLYEWLKRGGLSALLFEAQNLSTVQGYGVLEYVKDGEHAPATSRKADMAEDNQTEVERHIQRLADLVEARVDPDTGEILKAAESVCFPVGFVEDLVKTDLGRALYSFEKGPNIIKRLMKNRGWVYTGKNEKGEGTLGGWQYADERRKKHALLVSPALVEIAKQKNSELLRPYLKRTPADFSAWYDERLNEPF